MIDGRALRDFAAFAQWQVLSGDIDPAYPVLHGVERALCVNEDEEVSFSLLYVAFYNLSSAMRAWQLGWRPGVEPTAEMLALPCGTERRGHRVARNLLRHLRDLGDIHGLFGSWVAAFHPVSGTPQAEAWLQVQEQLRKVDFNGRWAAYKTGEILATVHGWPLRPTDAAHDMSTGPRDGLALLAPQVKELKGNSTEVIGQLDDVTDRLCALVGLPVEQVETCLCDFHALVDGRYYVGHDIDQQYQQTAEAPDWVQGLIVAARSESFGARWLCEESDDVAWTGVRPYLNTLYAREGRLDWWS